MLSDLADRPAFFRQFVAQAKTLNLPVVVHPSPRRMRACLLCSIVGIEIAEDGRRINQLGGPGKPVRVKGLCAVVFW